MVLPADKLQTTTPDIREWLIRSGMDATRRGEWAAMIARVT